jgi:hypothetical protein
MIFHLLILSFQINSFFHISDVKHIIQSKYPAPKIDNIYKDLKNLNHMIVSTKLSTHVILSYESNNVHVFFYDSNCITNCLWDGNLVLEQKKKVINNMLEWWYNGTNKICDYDLKKDDDIIAFNEVILDFYYK